MYFSTLGRCIALLHAVKFIIIMQWETRNIFFIVKGFLKILNANNEFPTSDDDTDRPGGNFETLNVDLINIF